MSEERIDDIIQIVNDEEYMPDVAPTAEEYASAEKIISNSEEVAIQNKEELEQLESPLIVHKLTDASYQQTASELTMEDTHTDDDGPTLERHRFRKVPKKNRNGIKIVLLLVVIAVAVLAGLYYGGVIDFGKESETTKPVSEATAESTTSLEQAYEGKIVVKGTFIFVDGVEVDGIEGLQNALKYVDPSPTAYEIVKEDANADFLNYDILPLMKNMGFYDENTVISTIVSTGLIAEEEKTTVPTTKKNNKKKNNKKKNNKTNPTKKNVTE